MILPPVVRVFFAIDLPQDVKESIGQYICSLKKKSRTNAIRWSRPENLHITLQFLAEVNSDHLPSLIENVKHRMEGVLHRSSLSLGEVQLFPAPYRPRVIVLDVTPQENLAQISSVIGQGIKESHYEIERRPFKAHLTIGRIKNPQGVNLDFLTSTDKPSIDPITINEVVLFRSEPEMHGSRYTPVERLAI